MSQGQKSCTAKPIEISLDVPGRMTPRMLMCATCVLLIFPISIAGLAVSIYAATRDMGVGSDFINRKVATAIVTDDLHQALEDARVAAKKEYIQSLADLDEPNEAMVLLKSNATSPSDYDLKTESSFYNIYRKKRVIENITIDGEAYQKYIEIKTFINKYRDNTPKDLRRRLFWNHVGDFFGNVGDGIQNTIITPVEQARRAMWDTACGWADAPEWCEFSLQLASCGVTATATGALVTPQGAGWTIASCTPAVQQLLVALDS